MWRRRSALISAASMKSFRSLALRGGSASWAGCGLGLGGNVRVSCGGQIVVSAGGTAYGSSPAISAGISSASRVSALSRTASARSFADDQ